MRVIASPLRRRAPVLSVLVPFYRDDPRATLLAIAALADKRVEILAWDDGTDDPGMLAGLESALKPQDQDVRVHVCPENRGRAAARNALFELARGEWVLFLDADMQPGGSEFLTRYLGAIASGRGDVFFGGFEVEPDGPEPTRLHRELSRASDCAPARERALKGPQHVASSNLCIRKDVLIAEPFDAGFSGWGWEDSEWAARVAGRFRVVHLDNPALHMGLETDDVLLHRFATSGPNYKRFTDAHPDFAGALPLYRHARKLAKVPGQALLRPLLKASVKAHALPVRFRVAALKLWRASHYAEVLRP